MICSLSKIPECLNRKGVCICCAKVLANEYQRQYYAKNREKVKAKVKTYYVPTGRPRGRPRKKN
jgi:CRISPR/Cas system-associated protein Csx1